MNHQSVNGVLSDDILPVHETVTAEGEEEVEEELDLAGLVSLAKEAKKVVREEAEPEVDGDDGDDGQDEDEEVTPVPLRKAQAAAKDMQTFVLDNITQFAQVEEVQAAANMLALALNRLTVSSTIQQRSILNFFPKLPKLLGWKEKEEEAESVEEENDELSDPGDEEMAEDPAVDTQG